jgi:hypothetical protein
MKHRMAVGAYRPKVIDRVEDVFLAYAAERLEVMNMDKAFTKQAVAVLEFEPTDRAGEAPMLNALPTRIGISLVYSHFDAFLRALKNLGGFCDFFSQLP